MSKAQKLLLKKISKLTDSQAIRKVMKMFDEKLLSLDCDWMYSVDYGGEVHQFIVSLDQPLPRSVFPKIRKFLPHQTRELLY